MNAQILLPIACAIVGIFLFFYKNHRHDKKVMDALPVKLIGDVGTGLFHNINCEAVKGILPENRKPLKLNKEINMYHLRPCPLCHPESSQLHGMNKIPMN